MERRLGEAADEGDVDKLRNLIKEYPLLLKALALVCGNTPLHVACIGGHVDFVKLILNLRPEFVEDLNQDGLSPLQIASANGDVDITKELLKVGSHLCLVQGNDNRIPLHSAVVKGRIEVIKELLSACHDSITQVTARGETCFHLAVKNNQFKALKALCDHIITYDRVDILNYKDEQGNTILHLAASRKQYVVIDLFLVKNLCYKGELEVNALNKKGLTPLDVLISEGGDSEIEEMFTIGSMSPSQRQSGQDERRDGPKSTYQKLQELFKYDRIKESQSEARSTLLVMAVLIATATYSAVLSPPGGVWQDDFWPDANRNTSSDKRSPHHTAGKAVMATHMPVCYCVFLVFNSLGLFISLQMMLLLCTLGLPLRFELRIAVFALGTTYGACLIAITPTGVLLMFVLILTLIAMTIPALTIVVRHFRKRRRSALPSRRVRA